MILRTMVFVAGMLVIFFTVGSAVRSVVLPRAVPARLTGWVFALMRSLFVLRAGPKANYERRDKVMALFAPVSLLTLVVAWEVLVGAGFAAMFWAAGSLGFSEAFQISGSSLLTLGTSRPHDLFGTTLMFAEAGLGLLLLALLITFLPSLYANFSRRETLVALLEIRGNAPPSAVEVISRYFRIHGLDRLSSMWQQWEVWFAEIEETHTSFPALIFFRSPQSKHSWVTAAGAVLDAAAFRASSIDAQRDPDAELCIRAGYVSLRRIAAFFSIPFDENPKPTDPITVSKVEFDETYSRLETEGVPLKPRDQAWIDFTGWRVNYDRVLVALATLTMAPPAPWSSDRSLTDWRPRRLTGLRRR
ncbi:MAG: hypothetical protein ABR507_09655 [Actinomycetota bacterium]|nr:hypothetical protein [Actinomycetota bacterium]